MDYCEFIKCHWGDRRFDLGGCSTAGSGETCYSLYSFDMPDNPKFIAYEIYLAEEIDLKIRCIFCDKELGTHPRDGKHHVLPKQFIKVLGLKSQDWEEYKDYKVPICNICHDILTELQKPMIFISKYFRGDHQLQLDITLPMIMSRIDEIRMNREDS